MNKKLINEKYAEILDNEILYEKMGDRTRTLLFRYTFLKEMQEELIKSFPYIFSSREKEEMQICWRYAKNSSDLIEVIFGADVPGNDGSKRPESEIVDENISIEKMGYDVALVQKDAKEIIAGLKQLSPEERKMFVNDYARNAVDTLKCLSEKDLVPKIFGE